MLPRSGCRRLHGTQPSQIQGAVIGHDTSITFARSFEGDISEEFVPQA